MTKSRKPAAITFPIIKTDGRSFRRNAETGIEIHSAKDDLGRTEYTIYRTSRDGTLDYWGTEWSLYHARALATERVEMVREEIAEDYIEALRMDTAEKDRVIAEIVTDIDAAVQLAAEQAPSKVVSTILYCARMSVQGGFVDAARNRLARALRIMDGTDRAPTDAESAAALAAAHEALPVGTLVRTEGGVARVYKPAIIVAESGLISVLLHFRSQQVDGRTVRGGYASRYVTEVEVV